MFLKCFKEWLGLKEKLHKSNHKPPFVSEGQIWWANIGENIGYEIDGKNDQFSRPVVVYKVLKKGFYFVIPLTTQQKTGSWFMQFRHGGNINTVCLHQSRSIDYRRVTNKLGEIDQRDMQRLKIKFKNLYL
jgi:mRNA interferase MazF